MWWEAANDMGHDNLGLVPDEVHGSSAGTPKPEPTPQPPAEKTEETPAQPESEDPPAE